MSTNICFLLCSVFVIINSTNLKTIENVEKGKLWNIIVFHIAHRQLLVTFISKVKVIQVL